MNDITAGEVDRRVERLEKDVVHRLDKISDKLDKALIGRNEYEADKRSTAAAFSELAKDVGALEARLIASETTLEGRIKESETAQDSRIVALINRGWWLFGVVLATVLGLAGLLMNK